MAGHLAPGGAYKYFARGKTLTRVKSWRKGEFTSPAQVKSMGSPPGEAGWDVPPAQGMDEGHGAEMFLGEGIHKMKIFRHLYHSMTWGIFFVSPKVAGSRTGRRGTFSYTRVVMLRLLTTPGFPPTRTGLRAAVRPCARPRCGPSGLFATAPRFFESTQRACPGGEPPGYPPAQFGYVLLFPASETGRFAGSISGLWPCAGMLSAVLCTQSGAYQGKKVGAWRPFHEFAFRIMPDQAPNWVCKTAPTLSAAGRSPLEGHLHRRVQDAGKLCWHSY